VVARSLQANAANQPGSAVDRFSFIGDEGDDESNVVYYVDDVLLSADGPVDVPAFVAPGRRRMFVDAWLASERELRRTRGCLPASDPEDFGFGAEEIREIGLEAAGTFLAAALDRKKGLAVPPPLERRLEPVAFWVRGCDDLRAGHAEQALAAFDAAARLEPDGRIYALSAVLALARLKRFEEADARLGGLAPAWRGDPRYDVTAAAIGLERDDLDRALEWLRAPAASAADSTTGHPAPIADQYFFVLLSQQSYDEARRYATRVADRLRGLGLPSHLWLERAADAAFFLGDHETARRLYQEALGDHGRDRLLFTKLSDVAFKSGDLAQERRYRQKVFGSLLEDER
jgi:tetratricopeptide (TPR) repeat protein